MSRTRKAIRIVDRSIDKAFTVLFLILLLIGIYFMADSWWVYGSSSQERIPGFSPETPQEIKEISPDAIAWITLDDTSISYPVMQGRDNSEYLNKNSQGEYSLSGAIFLDAANNPLFTDYYNVLYGHHMAGGYMFGAIDYYSKEVFFDKHRKGTLLVIDGKKYSLDIFAYVETDASVEVVFDVGLGGWGIMDYVAANAKVYREPVQGDGVIALTTCKSPLTTERTAIFATMKRISDKVTDEEVEEEVNKGNKLDLDDITRNPNYGEAIDRMQKGRPSLIERIINWFREHFN